MGTKELAADFIENPAAWPGGYPRYAITDDGGILCHDCVNDEQELISDSSPGDGWHITAIDINWEDGEMFCDHCNDRVPAAYVD